jgi:hypothetical protein
MRDRIALIIVVLGVLIGQLIAADIFETPHSAATMEKRACK